MYIEVSKTKKPVALRRVWVNTDFNNRSLTEGSKAYKDKFSIWTTLYIIAEGQNYLIWFEEYKCHIFMHCSDFEGSIHAWLP